MGRMMRSCVQSLLKLVNSVMGMVGIALILYALWLIRVWVREFGDSPFTEDDYSGPWFIYATLGSGVALCFLTCSGHIAASAVNGCCLYLYMTFVFVLITLEAGVTADIFLNSSWEEDFPEDPSKGFILFKMFIMSNFNICKWIGLSVVSVQVLSLLLAMVLKALGPHQYYDSGDEYDPERAPLLNHAIQPPPRYVITDPAFAPLK